jgi:hypothetical protein
MLKERTSSAPAARSDAASRLLAALLAASATPRGVPDRDLPAFLFVIDFGAFSTLGRSITDLPWMYQFASWEASGREFPIWAQRLRSQVTHREFESSPGTAFLSGLELELIRRAVDAWWSFDEPDRNAVWECIRTLEATDRESSVERPSLWDVGHMRLAREASIRRRLSGVSLDEAPRPTQEPDESEAIAAAVLDTILTGSI